MPLVGNQRLTPETHFQIRIRCLDPASQPLYKIFQLFAIIANGVEFKLYAVTKGGGLVDLPL